MEMTMGIHYRPESYRPPATEIELERALRKAAAELSHTDPDGAAVILAHARNLYSPSGLANADSGPEGVQ